MKRSILFLGGLAAAIAGTSVSTTNQTPAATGSSLEQLAAAFNQAVPGGSIGLADPKQAPTDLAVRPARPVQLGMPPLAADWRRFFERPARRRVKYGRSRWVVLS